MRLSEKIAPGCDIEDRKMSAVVTPPCPGTVRSVDHVIWTSRPGPAVTGSTKSLMVAGFTGWNDAGDAASTAIEHLWEQWGAVALASIDPEEYMDFSVQRPRITVEAGVVTQLSWPATEFGWCRPAGATSVVLVRGPEPQLRWRSYCESVLEVAEAVGCSTIITIGAMLSDVPHSRPTPVLANAHDPAVVEALPRAPHTSPDSTRSHCGPLFRPTPPACPRRSPRWRSSRSSRPSSGRRSRSIRSKPPHRTTSVISTNSAKPMPTPPSTSTGWRRDTTTNQQRSARLTTSWRRSSSSSGISESPLQTTPAQTTPDQTTPDQTTPDQARPGAGFDMSREH